MYVIILGGSPGTGKTSIGRILSGELDCVQENATSILKRVGGVEADPTGRDTLVATEDGLRKASAILREFVKRGKCIVLETVFPREWYDELEDAVLGVILLRCNPIELFERLRTKGWSGDKIIENVLSEAFNIIAEQLADIWYDTIEVDTTRKTPARAAEEALSKLLAWRTGIQIDWLTDEKVSLKVAEWSSRLDRDKYRLGV